MHANDFDYHRAGSVEEAIDLLGEHADAELLAGAHGLLPRMKTDEEAPGTLVDISRIDRLSAIEHDDGTLSVGALATHTDVADSEVVGRHAPALADATSAVGDLQVRAGGTIGGNLAHGDPRVDPAAAVLALDATVVVHGPDGRRSIPVTDLFEGEFETSVGDREVVTRLEVPTDDGLTSAYHKRRNPLSGYAAVGVAAAVRTDDGTVTDARVAATAVASYPRRLEAVEAELEGAVADESAAAAAAKRASESIPDDEVRSDPYASAEFRSHLLSTDTETLLSAVLADE
ncbi:FAD binding domain-containing protein [Natronomonas sp.]|uniref:FAD binding domain-containing protein n=1 Tax=Natronomonas sp. TaxID=2184060 RepID=UPI003975EDED